ncbi:metallophosphoesterase [Actinotalea sp. K2]|uniref:metallophosphoesterase family protein n=1 Tax=Actinotalea sp. K2 TaxID=2939438 RepID=UPI0020183831|nr:metallophosphoesterase [Actinotalea sp. K2]MCL3860568.1 metallophosphoesterase [Actinotalea sp. K2]
MEQPADRRPSGSAGLGHRLARWLLVVLAVLVPAALFGVTTARAEASLGPHLARYEVTTDHLVTVDLGPLGTLVIDSPLPLTLGARVVVQEIPRDVTAVEQADTLAALGTDLESYVQFFSGPQAALDVAVRALVTDAVRRTVLAALAVAIGAGLVRVLLGRARREELEARLAPHRRDTVLATGIVLVLAATVTSSDRAEPRLPDGALASRVFDDTPLEGARLTGRLAGVIDTYGGYVVEAYLDNETFYDQARSNLQVAWEARAAADAELGALRAAIRDGSPLPAPSPPPPATGEQDEVDGPTPAPTSSPSPTQGAEDGDDDAVPRQEAGAQGTGAAEGDQAVEASDGPEVEPVTLLVVSDLHCNVGMARVIREAAELGEVDVILNAGDTTVNGTAVESYCITAFAGAVPPGVTMVVSDGNHDSVETSAQERRAGMTVLDGKVVEVAGLRILGDSDPNATRIGIGTSPVGDESAGQMGRRLAEAACADPDGVDLLLVHTPSVGSYPLGTGCVPAQVSGHAHRRIGPVSMGEGVRYVSSSTAGAAHGQPTVGPLNGIAEMTILRFDPQSRRFLDYRLIRVHPDAAVDVGLALRWPGTSDPWLRRGIR